MVQPTSKKWKECKGNQDELNISLCYQFSPGFVFTGERILFVLGQQVQHKSFWELTQASLLPLPSLAYFSPSQTAGRGSHLELKPQAQGTGHLLGYENWEAQPWSTPYSVDIKWVIAPDMSVRDWGHALPLWAVRFSQPPWGAPAPPLLCSSPVGLDFHKGPFTLQVVSAAPKLPA